MCTDCKRHLGEHEGLPPTHLHKEEIYALFLRAGRCGGLKVKTEIPANWAGGNGAMDCAWYSAEGNLVAAFEFDGRDVGELHVRRNAVKFTDCPAPIKVQVLFSACNDLTEKGRSRASEVVRLVGAGVRVLTDVQLMSGGIEALVAEAARTPGVSAFDLLPDDLKLLLAEP